MVIPGWRRTAPTAGSRFPYRPEGGVRIVADKGLVAALPLSLSARPKEKSRTTHGEADYAPGGL
jgi:hypothetical protein